MKRYGRFALQAQPFSDIQEKRFDSALVPIMESLLGSHHALPLILHFR
jgi:hypothetical protein